MLSKEELLTASFGVEVVEIPGRGAVKVRALTRGQALEVQGKEMDVAEMERKLVAWAMVEPQLTEADVKAWQDNSAAGELQVVTEAIIRLSGMEKHADKAAVRTFRE